MIKKTALLILFGMLCTHGVKAEIDSGTCGAEGDNITWVLDDDYTLTLTGSGEMKSYRYQNYPPWSKYSDIKKIVIGNGIKDIGEFAFENCRKVTSVTIPQSVIKIGESAFCNCDNLTSIDIPSSVRLIGTSALT